MAKSQSSLFAIQWVVRSLLEFKVLRRTRYLRSGCYSKHLYDAGHCENDAACFMVGIAGLQAAVDAPGKVAGVQLLDVSLRMLHTKKQAPWQRPLVSAFQQLLRETPLGKLFFGAIAKPAVSNPSAWNGRSMHSMSCMYTWLPPERHATCLQSIKSVLQECYGNKDAVTDELVDCILKPGLTVRRSLSSASIEGHSILQSRIQIFSHMELTGQDSLSAFPDMRQGKMHFTVALSKACCAAWCCGCVSGLHIVFWRPSAGGAAATDSLPSQHPLGRGRPLGAHRAGASIRRV